MSRILIVYGTTSGHTAKVATALAQTLRERGSIVDVINAASRSWPSPSGYNAVIVAASVHGGRFQRSIARWVRSYARDLNKKPTAFVTVCLAAVNAGTEEQQNIAKVMDRFFHETGWLPTIRKAVAGALLYTKYNWLTRWMMRRIVSRHHGDVDTSRDYEYTDWNDLAEFARDFHERALSHTVALRASA